MHKKIGKTPEEIFLGGSFYVKSNRGIRRLLIGYNSSHVYFVAGLNEDSNDGLAVGVVYNNSVSETGGSRELVNADVLASLVGVVQINVSNYYVVVNSLGYQSASAPV